MQLIKERKLKGIIFLGGCFSHDEKRLKQITVPFVLSTISIFDGVDKNIYSSVSVDDIKESKKAIDCLCDYCHEKIAILAAQPWDTSISGLRVEGYKKALDTYGIPLDKNYILQTQGKEPSQIEAEILITDFLKTQRRIDGIFASSDLAALGALYALKRANLKVPEQVKLIGFDNTLYSRLPTPSISTIERNPKMLAEKGCEVLLNMIQGKDIGSIDTIVPVVLVERESSK